MKWKLILGISSVLIAIMNAIKISIKFDWYSLIFLIILLIFGMFWIEDYIDDKNVRT